MAPTTFNELVAYQQEVSARRTRAHGEEETARKCESENAVLEARLWQKDGQIQAQGQALQELSAKMQAKDKEADARTKMIQARDAKIAEMEESLRGLRAELVAKKALVDDSVEEKMAAARERYHAHETLRQEVLRANRLQREVDAGRARCRSFKGLILGLVDEVGALCAELEEIRRSERSAMVLVGREQARLGKEMEGLRRKMDEMRLGFDREVSIWVQQEEWWLRERASLVQQRRSAFEALAVLEGETAEVEVELAGVGEQLVRCQTELGLMASSVDFLADRLAERKELIVRGWLLVRMSLWVVEVLRVWGGYLWWLFVGARMVVGARDARIVVLSQRNERLGAAVATRDARIGVLDEQVGMLTGELGAVNARVVVLSGQVEKLWKGVAESRRTGAERLAEREELLQSLSARDARIQGLEVRVGDLEVGLLREGCPLVGFSPRDVIAEGGTLLATALEEWQRSQAGAGKSLAECVRGMGPVVLTMDGPSICAHGDSLVVIGEKVLVVPYGDYWFGDGEWEWVTVEYGSPGVVLRIANGESGPLDDMFPAAMAIYADLPLPVYWARKERRRGLSVHLHGKTGGDVIGHMLNAEGNRDGFVG